MSWPRPPTDFAPDIVDYLERTDLIKRLIRLHKYSVSRRGLKNVRGSIVKTGYDPITKETVLAEYNSGLNYREIATKHNASPGQVNNLLWSLGIRRRNV